LVRARQILPLAVLAANSAQAGTADSPLTSLNYKNEKNVHAKYYSARQLTSK
jgi:hypothetical protein